MKTANLLTNYKIIRSYSTHLILEDKLTKQTYVYKELPIPKNAIIDIYQELLKRKQLKSKNLLEIKYYSHENPVKKSRFNLLYENHLCNFDSELEKRLGTAQFWGEEELLNTIEAVLVALAELHSNNLVHGNITAQNIVFGEDKIVKLADQFVHQMQFKMNVEQLLLEHKSFLAPEIFEANQESARGEAVQANSEKKIADASDSATLNYNCSDAKCNKDLHQALFQKEILTMENDYWALGLTFLEAATLQRSVDFYDFQRKKINYELINQRLKSLKVNYSIMFINICKCLLNKKAHERKAVYQFLECSIDFDEYRNNGVGGNSRDIPSLNISPIDSLQTSISSQTNICLDLETNRREEKSKPEIGRLKTEVLLAFRPSQLDNYYFQQQKLPTSAQKAPFHRHSYTNNIEPSSSNVVVTTNNIDNNYQRQPYAKLNQNLYLQSDQNQQQKQLLEQNQQQIKIFQQHRPSLSQLDLNMIKTEPCEPQSQKSYSNSLNQQNVITAQYSITPSSCTQAKILSCESNPVELSKLSLETYNNSSKRIQPLSTKSTKSINNNTQITLINNPLLQKIGSLNIDNSPEVKKSTEHKKSLPTVQQIKNEVRNNNKQLRQSKLYQENSRNIAVNPANTEAASIIKQIKNQIVGTHSETKLTRQTNVYKYIPLTEEKLENNINLLSSDSEQRKSFVNLNLYQIDQVCNSDQQLQLVNSCKNISNPTNQKVVGEQISPIKLLQEEIEKKLTRMENRLKINENMKKISPFLPITSTEIQKDNTTKKLLSIQETINVNNNQQQQIQQRMDQQINQKQLCQQQNQTTIKLEQQQQQLQQSNVQQQQLSQPEAQQRLSIKQTVEKDIIQATNEVNIPKCVNYNSSPTTFRNLQVEPPISCFVLQQPIQVQNQIEGAISPTVLDCGNQLSDVTMGKCEHILDQTKMIQQLHANLNEKISNCLQNSRKLVKSVTKCSTYNKNDCDNDNNTSKDLAAAYSQSVQSLKQAACEPTTSVSDNQLTSQLTPFVGGKSVNQFIALSESKQTAMQVSPQFSCQEESEKKTYDSVSSQIVPNTNIFSICQSSEKTQPGSEIQENKKLASLQVLENQLQHFQSRDDKSINASQNKNPTNCNQGNNNKHTKIIIKNKINDLDNMFAQSLKRSQDLRARINRNQKPLENLISTSLNNTLNEIQINENQKFPSSVKNSSNINNYRQIKSQFNSSLIQISKDLFDCKRQNEQQLQNQVLQIQMQKENQEKVEQQQQIIQEEEQNELSSLSISNDSKKNCGLYNKQQNTLAKNYQTSASQQLQQERSVFGELKDQNFLQINITAKQIKNEIKKLQGDMQSIQSLSKENCQNLDQLNMNSIKFQQIGQCSTTNVKFHEFQF